MRTEPRSKRRQRLASPEAGGSSQPEPAQGTSSEPTGAAKSEPPASGVSEPGGVTASPERLTVSLKADGTIELEGMRSSTKEKLRKAMSDASLGSRLGVAIEGAPLSSPDAFFGPVICGVLYDTASKLMIALALKSGYPVEQALTLQFTREEVEQLAPITGKVLDKWIPIGGKYQDEAMLALMLFSIVNGKVALMRKPAKVVPIRVETPAERPSPPEGAAS